MVAINCTERFQERTFNSTMTLEAGEGGAIRAKVVRTHTRSFEVVCSSKWDDGFVASQHYLVPRHFDPHPTDPTCSVRKVTPSVLAGATVWKIMVEYSSEVPDPGDYEEHPLLRPVKAWMTAEEVKIPLFQDRFGNPVINTAGVAYDPPVEITSINKVYHFERNEASWSEAKVDAYLNHLNSSSFCGKPPRHVRCRKFDPQEQREKQIKYFKVGYEFEYNQFGFDPRPLSRGVLQIDEEWYNFSGEVRHIRIKDRMGRDVTQAIPLSGDGYALQPGDVLSNPNLLEYQTFEGLEEMNFGALNLPQNGAT